MLAVIYSQNYTVDSSLIVIFMLAVIYSQNYTVDSSLIGS